MIDSSQQWFGALIELFNQKISQNESIPKPCLVSNIILAEWF